MDPETATVAGINEILSSERSSKSGSGGLTERVVLG